MSKNKDFDSQKDAWCIVQEIPHNTIFMFSLIYYMANGWPKYGFGDKLKLFVAYFKGEDSSLYCNEREFDQEAKFVADQIINKPDWAIKELAKVKDWSKQFIESSKKLYSFDYSSVNPRDILEQYQETAKYFSLSQANGAALTWLTETRREFVAKACIEMLETQLAKHKLSDNVAEVFNILTGPKQESFVAQEERELLEMAQAIIEDEQMKRIFLEKDVTQLYKIVSEGKDKEFKKIFDHYIEWRWLFFGYKGPAPNLNYFLKRLRSFIKSNNTPKDIINTNSKQKINSREKEQELLAKLQLDNYQSNLIEFIQLSSYIKDYRKGATYYAMYCYEHLFQYIADKMGASMDSVWSMYAPEIEDYLSGKNIPSKEVLLERQNECIILIDKHKYQIIVGKKVKEILNPILEKSLIDENIDEIHGMAVCLGYAKGKVKIVEKVEDMSKMNVGDILVSHITYPNLVPAMRKASAIITNVGGVICHAAIIAREFNIPCIVGTKIATKVLKDGDMVEVDANNGIVRKLG